MNPLEILIGDDLFGSDEERLIREHYIPPLEEAVGRKINVTYRRRQGQVIEEARKGTYDIIVTDLQYGEIREGEFENKEGFKVIRAVRQMVEERAIPKPYLILFTNAEAFDCESVPDACRPDAYALGGKGTSKVERLFELLKLV
jgi:hypothetical protein